MSEMGQIPGQMLCSESSALVVCVCVCLFVCLFIFPPAPIAQWEAEQCPS